MADGGGDVSDELVPPRNLLVLEKQQLILARSSLLLLVDQGQINAEDRKCAPITKKE